MKVRKLCEEDRPLLAEWIQANPFHRDYSPDVFFTKATDGIVFEDDHGPIAMAAVVKVVRVLAEFPPGEKDRIREALPRAFALVATEARKGGFQEMAFETKSESLIRFCKKHLGFREAPDEFVVDISG